MLSSFGRLAVPFALVALMGLFIVAGEKGLTAVAADPDAQRAAFFAQQAAVDPLPPEQQPPALGATPCENNSADIYDCLRVDLLSFMPLADIGGGSVNDIWGWTDPQTDKEYALVGRSGGTSFVDVSDPINPIYLGQLPTHTSSTTWRDVKVYADHAYIVSEAGGHGMQVFDLTFLRDAVSPPYTFLEDGHYSGFSSAHNIVINEDTGFGYAVGSNNCGQGLHMVDLANPLVPVFAGCYADDGYTHDAQCVVYNGPDVVYQGQEICFNANEDTVTIVDVTDKTTPVLLARIGYSGAQYTHQGWLTEDHQYFLFNDELDEANLGHKTRTRVLDLTVLDSPTLVGSHDGPNDSIDHNLYVKGQYAFMSNYSSGLQIYDLTDPSTAALSLVGFFDNYPANNNTNFNGSWSNYPYFASGIVIATSRTLGLFVLQPNLGAGVSVPETLNGMGVEGADVVYQIEVTNTGVATDTFSVDVGPANWVTTPAATTVGPVAPGAMITLPVTVTVGSGSSDEVVITFASLADAGISDSVTVHTDAVAESSWQFLPVVQR